MRTRLLRAVVVLSWGQLAGAQDTSASRVPRLELGAQYGSVFIYVGDAPIGNAYAATSARIGWRSAGGSGRLVSEAYALRAPQHREGPEIFAAGLAARVGLRRVGEVSLEPFLTAGFGWYRVAASTQTPCFLDFGCFREGGPDFRDATSGQCARWPWRRGAVDPLAGVPRRPPGIPACWYAKGRQQHQDTARAGGGSNVSALIVG